MFSKKKSFQSRKALSHKQENSLGCGCFSFFFFGIFLLLGGVNSYMFLFAPLSSYLAVQSWEATPCEILTSGWHPIGNGEFSVRATYAYQYAGEDYQSSQFRHAAHGNAHLVSDPAWEQILQPGKAATCYVNSTQPAQAVLNRDFPWTILIGIVPLIFMLIGLGGLIMTPILAYKSRQARKKGLSHSASSSHSPTVWTEDEQIDRQSSSSNSPSWTCLQTALQIDALDTDSPREQIGDWRLTKQTSNPWQPSFKTGPQELKSHSSRLANFVFLLIFTLIWNAVISFAASDLLFGNGDWIPLLFVSPFVLVGLGLLAGCVYCFLGLFNPRVQLYVSEGAVPLGESIRVKWVLLGKIESIRQFNIRLRGEESAEYRRGTKTVTDTNKFFEQELLTTQDHFEIESGELEVTLPANSMHSFAASRNKIQWSLHFHGDIALWPDVQESFPLVVLPSESNVGPVLPAVE